MKIHQLLSKVDIALSNEEHRFLENHEHDVRITSLDDHDRWVAQNLVRKGVYEISKDNNTLVNKLNETDL
jgi:hypothetical protein